MGDVFLAFLVIVGIIIYNCWDALNFIVAIFVAGIPTVFIVCFYGWISEAIVDCINDPIYQEIVAVILIIIGIVLFCFTFNFIYHQL